MFSDLLGHMLTALKKLISLVKENLKQRAKMSLTDQIHTPDVYLYLSQKGTCSYTYYIPQSEKEKRKGIKLPPFFFLLWENSVIYKVDRLFIKVLAVSSSKNSKVIKKMKR